MCWFSSPIDYSYVRSIERLLLLVNFDGVLRATKGRLARNSKWAIHNASMCSMRFCWNFSVFMQYLVLSWYHRSPPSPPRSVSKSILPMHQTPILSARTIFGPVYFLYYIFLHAPIPHSPLFLLPNRFFFHCPPSPSFIWFYSSAAWCIWVLCVVVVVVACVFFFF